MNFNDYLEHYFEVPAVLYMSLVAVLVFLLMHLLIFINSKIFKREPINDYECYYEMMISSSSMLLFIGLYFLVDYRYFNFSEKFYENWNRFNDFLLLFALMISVLLMNILDRVIIPLRTINHEKRAALRMLAMVYMLVIFFYIKFIYLDDNYDAIITYVLIMVIGRYVYFDASFKDFVKALKSMFFLYPILILAIVTTSLLAYYGFTSGYLLKKNGVVVSLYIAHLFIIVQIFIAHIFQKLRGQV